ncbi:hypothetical protein UVI_02020740 [Ustilaginoidea virens]|uniref:AAA+ ATPase domain-containing protein n=1 Tax=Ustilaginoidea virens TaxID=1159556 RepID=A0A1B5KWU8_USTVR|nr:hypothetical protein UVI_02020740 [Ustilaginoidea virens]
MAPPAKRRRRNPLDASDDEEQPQANNTLANFLLSSPVSLSPPKHRVSTPSPSPLKARIASRPSASSPSPPKTRRGGASHKIGRGSNATKSRDAGRSEEKKGKTADLKTLFSNQAQRASTARSNAETRPSPVNDPISDPISEDDEISSLKASSSSLVGQHARKRLRNGSVATSGEPLSAGLKFLKPPKPTNPIGADDELRPWPERFGPLNLDELAVHKKKVANVRRWLEEVMAGRLRQRLLVLKGPAGSGKTTTVRLLANDLGCELLEWKNPATTAGPGFLSASAQFGEFLGRGGKFGTLETDGSSSAISPISHGNGNGNDPSKARRIMLVEEFPNTFSRSSSALSSFRGVILEYLAAHASSSLAQSGAMAQHRTGPASPIVLVISETLLTTTSASADSLTAHRLLGPEILGHPGVGMIEFNAVAPSILTKALELVVVKEARKSGRRMTPGPQVLQRLGEIGDIRNAVSSLEFLCLKGDENSDWGAKIAFKKPKKSVRGLIGLTKGESESLQSISQREASLGIFHAVGKVVYNKRDEAAPSTDTVETLPPFLSQNARPKRSQVSVDSLIDETGTDTDTFISALHENYILSCESTGPMDLSTPMDYVNDCIEHLSESDLLCPSRDVFSRGRGGFGGWDSSSHVLRQDEITFHVAVRGMLFSLPNPVKRKTTTMAKGSDAFKMFYPTSLKLWKAKEEIEGMVGLWSSKILKGELQHPTKNLTDGAGAFLPTQPSGESASWMQRQQQARSAAAAKPQGRGGEEGSEPSPPLLSLGSAAQREMLLDRLPFMAHIARGRNIGVRARDVEKMVSFHGISVAGDQEESEAEDDFASGEPWATDRPCEERSPRKRRAGIKTSAMSGMLARKLVLSDDDIED